MIRRHRLVTAEGAGGETRAARQNDDLMAEVNAHVHELAERLGSSSDRRRRLEVQV
jgi:hypothetical protein